MYKIVILINSIGIISSTFLEAELNYRRPKLERNNIVNKGLWVRNNDKRPNSGAFIFRANSLDVDNLLQGNNDVFSGNSPFISSYVERNKRSAYNKQKQRLKERINNCANAEECTTRDVLSQSNLINKLKPTFFNDYPYGFAIVISDSANMETNNMVKRKTDEKSSLQNKPKASSHVEVNNMNKTLNQKRSMSDFYDFQDVKKVEITETINDTDEENKINRSVFDKEKDIVWHQTAPVNVYQVLPKNKDGKDKHISERGLAKVISMLTKTFKKIMKQHSDIKVIHKQLKSQNEEVEKKIEIFNKKLIDFDLKYDEILKVNIELKKFEEKLTSKEKHLNDKEREFSKNLLDFENQQKKFLAQQKQFYSIQKLMLEENERINAKQNIIAKTHSEITQKQNNFGRFLKKMQLVKPPGVLNIGMNKPKIPIQTKTAMNTSTQKPISESVKINLLSVQEKPPIQNYDKLILGDKDDQNIDDLIYKYYFNNTFIEDIMKNKILASFTAEKRATKKTIKRNNNIDKKNTILLPVDKTTGSNLTVKNEKQREKRWIKRVKKNDRRRNTIATTTVPTAVDKDKLSPTNSKLSKLDPFIIMANTFCNEIGQNGTSHILSWCIEKALRRLQIMNLKYDEQINLATETIKRTTVEYPTVQSRTTNPDTTPYIADVTRDKSSQNTQEAQTSKSPFIMYFPDNEELESNLKQYELVQDNEGTVYFDGSLHSSDIARVNKLDTTDSEGFSDIMPGLDSNSRVDVDPLAFHLQAQRRANVRRINERIIKTKMVK